MKWTRTGQSVGRARHPREGLLYGVGVETHLTRRTELIPEVTVY